jgi:hypothetical protein
MTINYELIEKKTNILLVEKNKLTLLHGNSIPNIGLSLFLAWTKKIK